MESDEVTRHERCANSHISEYLEAFLGNMEA